MSNFPEMNSDANHLLVSLLSEVSPRPIYSTATLADFLFKAKFMTGSNTTTLPQKPTPSLFLPMIPGPVLPAP
jgi:hypothetical protein